MTYKVECHTCGGNYYKGYVCKGCGGNILGKDKKKEVDRVNKPDHYNHNATGIECIDAIKAATGEHFEGYLQGNIIKYLWRYRYKNDVEDINKAQVYMKWLEDYRKEKANV